MQPQTIRLDTEEWEQLETEAGERGFGNRTEYIRWILRNRHAIEEPTSESVEDRMAEMEARIEAIEAKLDDRCGENGT